jgi:hypothetical protein
MHPHHGLVEKFGETRPVEQTMRLQFLGTSSEQGTCPAVYETDRGTLAVQGRLVVEPEALGDSVNLGSDEVIIEIPRELIRFFPTTE